MGLTWAAHLFVLLSRVSLIEIAQPKIIINTKRAGRTKKYCVENQLSSACLVSEHTVALSPAAQKVFISLNAHYHVKFFKVYVVCGMNGTIAGFLDVVDSKLKSAAVKQKDRAYFLHTFQQCFK